MAETAQEAPSHLYGAPVGKPEVTRHVSHPPSRTTDEMVRCGGTRTRGTTEEPCGRLLFEMATRPWRATCPRCHQVNESPPLPGPEGVSSLPG